MKHLKDKKVKTVLNVFMKAANESCRKLNKLLVDQGGVFIINLCKDG